ncbi:MAG: 50S ribosomal protein L11 methyltransferase [Anaerolineaceae bacterium]|nr:50S ribosomal protein L11 methyltransferase [Anaerolineaceae bacterium]
MADQQWLEVSMTVENGEIAEAVAEILSRFVQNGVVTERDAIHSEGYDIGVPVGAYHVFGYLPVDETLEQVRQKLSEAIWHLNLIQPVPDPEFRMIANQNWMEAWKEHFHPIPIGERLMIIPSWVENPEPDRIPIAIDPNMAFGTGTHPTTQLCMQLLEKYAQPGQPLIDLGCGSGILSITGVKLGMKPVVAVDIEQDSVNATLDNAARNGVAEAITVGKGSVKQILAGEYPLKQAPLMVVNILAPIILRLFDDGLTDLVVPGGMILFSGVMIELETEFIAKAKAQNLEILEQVMQGDWIAFAMRRG